MNRTLWCAAAIAILTFACGATPILNPKTGPGTSYPCGINGVSCPDHMCCPQDNVCGGGAFSGCPVDMCCYVGPGVTSTWTGAGKMTPQWPEAR